MLRGSRAALHDALALTDFANSVFPNDLLEGAAEYFVGETLTGVAAIANRLSDAPSPQHATPAIAATAKVLCEDFANYVEAQGQATALQQIREQAAVHSPVDEYQVLVDWLSAFAKSRPVPSAGEETTPAETIQEAAAGSFGWCRFGCAGASRKPGSRDRRLGW